MSSAPRTWRACSRSATASRCCRATGEGYHEEWRSTLQAPAARTATSPSTTSSTRATSSTTCCSTTTTRRASRRASRRARRNGRAQRTALTRDMWESLNSAWLEFCSHQAGERHRRTQLPRAARLDAGQRSALYRGALLNTILRNDTYLLQPARHLPRARRQHRAHPRREVLSCCCRRVEMVGGGVDNVQWDAILRSVSAHRSYRWVYKENYQPWSIAEYLILNRQMPRSLRSCYDEMTPRSTTRRALRRAARLPRDRGSRRATCCTKATSTRSSSRACTSSCEDFIAPQQPARPRDRRGLSLQRLSRSRRHAHLDPPRDALPLRRRRRTTRIQACA